MNKLLLLSLLVISGSLFAQEVEHVKVTHKLKESDFFPSISGYYKDEIPVEKLGDLDGIQTPLHWQVLSYKIGYPSGAGYKTYTFNTHLVPDSIVLDIRLSCIGEQVYFTDIEAKDAGGIIRSLVSMSLIPILKDDE